MNFKLRIRFVDPLGKKKKEKMRFFCKLFLKGKVKKQSIFF